MFSINREGCKLVGFYQTIILSRQQTREVFCSLLSGTDRQAAGRVTHHSYMTESVRAIYNEMVLGGEPDLWLFCL